MRLEKWKRDALGARTWRGSAFAAVAGTLLATTSAPGQFIEHSEIIQEFRGENQGDHSEDQEQRRREPLAHRGGPHHLFEGADPADRDLGVDL